MSPLCHPGRLNTTVAPLIFADQFLQISTALPSRFLYGLGEHRSTLLHSLDWSTLTLWARDVSPTVPPGRGAAGGEPWSQQGQGVVTGRCWGGFGCDCKTHPECSPVAATSKTAPSHRVTDARLGGGWHRAAEVAWGRWLA